MAVNSEIKLGEMVIANQSPLTLIAGPCQMETRQHAFGIAGRLAKNR